MIELNFFVQRSPPPPHLKYYYQVVLSLITKKGLSPTNLVGGVGGHMFPQQLPHSAEGYTGYIVVDLPTTGDYEVK